jgi:branched-subunit amino acid ABC-type transport system permease component
VAAMVIGLVDNLITPITSITNFRDMTPFVLAIAALLFFSRERQYSFARGGIR